MECRNFTRSVSDCGINADKHCKDLVVMACRTNLILHVLFQTVV